MRTFNDMYAESATTATFTIGFGTVPGKLTIISPYAADQGATGSFGSFVYDGNTCTLSIGDNMVSKPGKIILGRSGSANQSIALDAAANTITVGDKNAGNGHIKLRNRVGNETITLNGETATLTLGTAATTTNSEPQNDGELVVKNKTGIQTAKIDGASGMLTLGGSATDGDIIIKNSGGNNTIVMDGGNAALTVGGIGANGDIIVKNSNDIDTIRITGSNGDIEFLNADFAEEFDIATEALAIAVPGTVMSLGANGTLVPSTGAYDSRVAGIIAGAGSYRPGIVMDKKGGAHRRPVAMVGKVFCKAEALDHAIQEGDLLTTSPHSGFAMKATDRERSFGATIGKALGRLDSGTGLIPVLVTLQ